MTTPDNLDTMTTAQLAAIVGWTPLNRPLITKEAADLRGLRPNTLEIERHTGKGPPYFQPDGPGGRVTYSERVLLLHMLRGLRRHTSQPHPPQPAAVPA